MPTLWQGYKVSTKVLLRTAMLERAFGHYTFIAKATISKETERAMTNGKWKLAGIYPALVISSGNIFLGDRHPKGLYIEEVMRMMKAHPNDSYYGKKGKRKIALYEAMQHGELEKLGEEQETHTSIDLLLMEQDREFEKLPRTGKELLEKHYRSKPYYLEKGGDA